MIELFEQNERKNDRQSSKGNQLKWENRGIWYDEQLELSEQLYKMNLKFTFTKKDVRELLEPITDYSEEIKNRVEEIIYAQMRRYNFAFEGKQVLIG